MDCMIRKSETRPCGKPAVGKPAVSQSVYDRCGGQPVVRCGQRESFLRELLASGGRKAGASSVMGCAVGTRVLDRRWTNRWRRSWACGT